MSLIILEVPSHETVEVRFRDAFDRVTKKRVTGFDEEGLKRLEKLSKKLHEKQRRGWFKKGK